MVPLGIPRTTARKGSASGAESSQTLSSRRSPSVASASQSLASSRGHVMRTMKTHSAGSSAAQSWMPTKVIRPEGSRVMA